MSSSAGRPNRRIVAIVSANFAILLVLAGVLASILSSPYEVTRLRNSLIAETGDDSDFDWSPDSVPRDFDYETMQAPPELATALQAVVEASGRGDHFATGLSIARHLADGPGVGPGILSDTVTTYQTIMRENRGYCSDYTQVFNGFAIAADIPVREWGMSFDGYSGDGHAFNEVYHDALGKWVLIDSFYSFYVTEASSGVPLSVREFRDRLLDGATSSDIRVVPIDAERHPFRDADAALDYYRRGADQMFLWFGNDVFSYDASAAVSIFGNHSRALEQALAIISGAHPRIKLVVSDTNGHLVSRLKAARLAFIGGTAVAVAAVCMLLYQFVAWRRNRRR